MIQDDVLGDEDDTKRGLPVDATDDEKRAMADDVSLKVKVIEVILLKCFILWQFQSDTSKRLEKSHVDLSKSRPTTTYGSRGFHKENDVI